MDKIFRLNASIQHYDWGGFTFIPSLLGLINKKEQPFAELWMGTHHNGPATLTAEGEEISLEKYFSKHPEALGEKLIGQFGVQLPFLFKVLDVRDMLSIQSHPTKKVAMEGFKKENEAGIPLNAPHRNYKDDNHKPEIMVALSDFYLLHGFKQEEEIINTLNKHPEFNALLQLYKKRGLKNFYQELMEMPQPEVDTLLEPLGLRLQKEDEQKKIEKTEPAYWALKAINSRKKDEGFDLGIFSIFLFNLVYLKKGEGIFQDAGIPHAYLEGKNVELMANSDNVFRGGLTPKHIDINELMENLNFEAVTPYIIRGNQLSPTEMEYPTTAPDFLLSKIILAEKEKQEGIAKEGPEIFIVVEGELEVNENTFERGSVFFCPAQSAYFMQSEKGALVFKAGMPS